MTNTSKELPLVDTIEGMTSEMCEEMSNGKGDDEDE